MSSFGIPYMGSKNTIIKTFINIFPSCDNFYDLFGGGGAVAHAMLKLRKKDFKNFYYNEIDSNVCKFLKDCIDGKYLYENFKPEFISREEFFLKKETDAYIKFVWSFGNKGYDYLYGKDIEKNKESVHNAVFYNIFDLYIKKTLGMSSFADGYSIDQMKNFISGERVQHFSGITRLNQLHEDNLQELKITNLDYKKVKIKKNSIIYCDPPYKNTKKYKNKLSRPEFYDWCDAQENPVFISEYGLEDSRFKEILSFRKCCHMSDANNKKTRELIYANKAALKVLKI